MDLAELRAYLAVIEHGSVRAAAAALQLPRTTVRRRIDALEARTGVALVMGTRDGMEATEAGVVLAVRGRRLLQDAEALVETVRKVDREPQGTLRIACAPGLHPALLTAFYARWRARYPKLTISQWQDEAPLGRLERQADVAVWFGDTAPSIAGVRAWSLLRCPERLLASPAYLERHGAPRTAEALAEHRLLRWRASADDDACTLPLADGRVISVEPEMVSADVYMLHRLARAGHGIALVPDADLPVPGEPDDALEVVPLEGVGRECSIWVAIIDARSATPALRAVVADFVPLVEDAIRILAQLQRG